MRRYDIIVSLEFDSKFFAITPAFNVNRGMRAFEIEWLCFGVYIQFPKVEAYEPVEF